MIDPCKDCSWSFDYYMASDEVWGKAGLLKTEHCCLACLERRLARPLTIADFPMCGVNRAFYAAVGKLSALLEREQQREDQWRQESEAAWREKEAARERRRAQREADQRMIAWMREHQGVLF